MYKVRVITLKMIFLLILIVLFYWIWLLFVFKIEIWFFYWNDYDFNDFWFISSFFLVDVIFGLYLWCCCGGFVLYFGILGYWIICVCVVDFCYDGYVCWFRIVISRLVVIGVGGRVRIGIWVDFRIVKRSIGGYWKVEVEI